MRPIPLLELVWLAVRERVRSLWRAPAFSASVLLCFVLAGAANATMLGLAERAFFWRPSGVEQPSELHRLWVRYERAGRAGEYTADLGYPYFAQAERAVPAGGMAGYAVAEVESRTRADAETGRIALASRYYFRVLGAHAALGRLLTAQDAEPGAAPAAVISYATWKRRFHGDSAALGTPLFLGRRAFTVVGVTPDRFSGAEPEPIDTWVPIGALGEQVWGTGWDVGLTSAPLRTLVRLPVASTAAGLQARVNTALRPTQIDLLKHQTVRIELRPFVGEAGPDGGREARLALWLLAMSAVVLLIAAVNVAALFAGRTAHRAPEISLRSALGASRVRLAGDAAAEALLLAGGAFAIIGLLVVAVDPWLKDVLLAVPAPGSLVSATSLAICGGVLVTIALACGVVPLVSGVPGSAFVRQSSGVRSSLGPRLGRALLIAQIAAAVLLAGEASLFAASLRNIHGVMSGLALERVVAVTVHVPMGEAETPSTKEAYRELRAAVAAAVPRSTLVAASQGGPFGARAGVDVNVPGMPPHPLYDPATGSPYYWGVEPAFFEILGLHLRAGRLLDSTDTETAPHVAVVNETLARELGASGPVLGRCLYLGSDPACSTVVGIVADHPVRNVVDKPFGMLYVPLEVWSFAWTRTVYVRTATPGATRRGLEAALSPLRARFLDLEVQWLPDLVAPQIRTWRTGSTVFVGFALCALVLTACGVYGTTLTLLALRRRELAVRKALGASLAQLAGAAAGPVLTALASGVAFGVALGLAGGQLLAAFLFGVQPTSVGAIGGAAATVALAVLLAVGWPVVRATGEGLLTALRSE